MVTVMLVLPPFSTMKNPRKPGHLGRLAGQTTCQERGAAEASAGGAPVAWDFFFFLIFIDLFVLFFILVGYEQLDIGIIYLDLGFGYITFLILFDQFSERES